MDVKSTFVNGGLEEEVYIEQLVPKAWYCRLDKYLQHVGFRKVSVDNNLYIKNGFEMSLLGELSFFLGLQIHLSNQGIFISQTKYIREMLKRFGMEHCKPVTTPMKNNCKMRKDDDSKSTDQRKYRSMIGSLLYVIASRPDVIQAVGQVERFQAAPKESHGLAVKRIF
jgi:hypothetical protein